MKLRIAGEPNRASSLNSLTKCQGLVAMRATEEDSVSGPAADLGTGVGRGEELWHRGYTLAKLTETLREEHPKEFPKADMKECLKIVTFYVNDPRNRPNVVVTRSLEQEVKLVLPPAPNDPSGQLYEVTGHMDQIRYVHPDHPERERLGYRLWDGKNGKADGETMLGDYAFQLAAYTVAAADSGEYPGLAVGGVIRTKGYIHRGKKEPGTQNVFFHAGWTIDKCRGILANVMQQIGEIRAGRIAFTPGAHCRYCPEDFPNCVSDGLVKGHLDQTTKLRGLPCVKEKK